jgi:hypothetical protein
MYVKVSSENFWAPFQSVTNVVTLFAVLLLFVVFRVSGGFIGLWGYNEEENDSYSYEESLNNSQPRENREASVGSLQESERRPLVGSGPRRSENVSPPSDKALPSSKQGLDDIEKDLGLR